MRLRPLVSKSTMTTFSNLLDILSYLANILSSLTTNTNFILAMANEGNEKEGKQSDAKPNEVERQDTVTDFVLPEWNWKEQKSLELGSEEHWIKFVCDIEQTDHSSSSDQSKNSPKRLLTNLDSWLDVLDVPRESFELMYRLGQRTSEFHKIKVENFAPYLLKDGMSQRVTQYVEENWYRSKVTKPTAVHVLERFRYRMDKMNARETFPDEAKIIERFGVGRKDRLKQRDFFTMGSQAKHDKTEDVATFYHTSRMDGLSKRIVLSDDMELTEEYIGREDGLISMQVTFGVAKKEFGPAEGKGAAREVAKIIERFADRDLPCDAQDGQGGDEEDLGDPDDLDSDYTPGRVLDTRRVLERIFDLDSDRILIKFHREGGQIFCKTAEFLAPTQSEPQPTTEKDKGGKEQELDTKDIPNLSEQDVKIYLVNPRDNKPSLLELSDIYREQVVLQRAAVKRVAIIQKEMHKLVEDRMKELSAHDMEVWIFDTKRNPQVTRGRQEQENAARKREEDVMDLELDFLAPYLQRFPDVNSLSKAQALGIQFLPK